MSIKIVIDSTVDGTEEVKGKVSIVPLTSSFGR